MHARNLDGERIQVDGKGYVPKAQWDFVASMQEMVRLHAGGASYVDLGRHMAELGIERRGQKRKELLTMAELVAAGDHNTVAEAAKSFFTSSSASPTREPDIYLQKVRLWRTGVFHTRVDNEIRGRGITVAGLTPTYRGDEDEYGYFDIRVNWPWPTDPATGEPLEAWGVADELAKSDERLLAEIATPRPTGGAAHRRPAKRAVTPSEWTEAGRAHSVQPRQHNSGRNTCVIFSNSQAARHNRKGWSIERANPQMYALASFPLTDLCGSLASAIERTVLEVLDPRSVAPVVLRRERSSADEQRFSRERRVADLEAKLQANDADEQRLRDDAEGQELLAGRRLKNGDEAGAAKAEGTATELLAKADALVSERERLMAAIAAAVGDQPDTLTGDRAEASLNVAAYLVAGLRRARVANGLGPPLLRDLTSEHVTDWRMTAEDGAVRWSAQLTLPLIDGGVAIVSLGGVIEDIRTASGGRSTTDAAVLAEQLLIEGRTLEEIALTSGVATSRRALLTKHLMPWLKAKGVVTRGASR